jgi:hypothetical protein
MSTTGETLTKSFFSRRWSQNWIHSGTCSVIADRDPEIVLTVWILWAVETVVVAGIVVAAEIAVAAGTVVPVEIVVVVEIVAAVVAVGRWAGKVVEGMQEGLLLVFEVVVQIWSFLGLGQRIAGAVKTVGVAGRFVEVAGRFVEVAGRIVEVAGKIVERGRPVWLAEVVVEVVVWRLVEKAVQEQSPVVGGVADVKNQLGWWKDSPHYSQHSLGHWQHLATQILGEVWRSAELLDADALQQTGLHWCCAVGWGE